MPVVGGAPVCSNGLDASILALVELQVLRHRAVCSGCGSKLPPRASAWVHRGEDRGEQGLTKAAVYHQVVCESCHRAGSYPTPSRPVTGGSSGTSSPAEPPPAPPAPEPLSEAAVEAVAQSVAQSVARSVAESVSADSARRAEEAVTRAKALAALAEPTTAVAPLNAGPLADEVPPPVTFDSAPSSAESLDAQTGEVVDPRLLRSADAAPHHELDAADVVPVGWSAADELFQGPPANGWLGDRSKPPPQPSLPNTEPGQVQPTDPTAAPAPEPVGVRARRQDPVDLVGRVLTSAENRGLVWLGPRTTPEGRTVDHVVLSPNGLWLVRTEEPPAGRVERRDLGDWFTPDPRLYVGAVDRTALVADCGAGEASVARALVASPLEAVPRYQVVCFQDAAPAWFPRPFELHGVWITWSRHLVEPMLATVHLQRAEVARLADLLDRILERG